jgi:uncharacterized protein YybS (DUF2232 family)
LTVLIYVLNFYTRLLTIVLPVPAAVMVVRHDLRTGATATLASALGVTVLLGPVEGLIVLASVGFIGLTLGSCIARRLSWVRTIGITAVAAAAMIIVDFLAGAAVVGMSPSRALAEMERIMVESWEQSLALYSRLGMSEAGLKPIRDMLEWLPKMVRMLLPAVVIGGAVTLASFSYAATRMVLVRTRREVDPIPPFMTWKLPWYWAWGFIIGLLAAQAGAYFSSEVLTAIGLNFTSLFQIIFSVQGLAVLWFVLDRYGIPKGAKFVIVAMIVMSSALLTILPLVGLLDGWFDFRKRLAAR